MSPNDATFWATCAQVLATLLIAFAVVILRGVTTRTAKVIDIPFAVASVVVLFLTLLDLMLCIFVLMVGKGFDPLWKIGSLGVIVLSVIYVVGLTLLSSTSESAPKGRKRSPVRAHRMGRTRTVRNRTQRRSARPRS